MSVPTFQVPAVKIPAGLTAAALRREATGLHLSASRASTLLMAEYYQTKANALQAEAARLEAAQA